MIIFWLSVALVVAACTAEPKREVIGSIPVIFLRSHTMTEFEAWQEYERLSHALSGVEPGDTILLRDGVY